METIKISHSLWRMLLLTFTSLVFVLSSCLVVYRVLRFMRSVYALFYAEREADGQAVHDDYR